ncbi:hypothetical protein, partial [Aliarcobacter cryaerophilus]|uniref:hypothetical protein n=1 Tax=Aliarcobacter cryaerophilus TaxID=28198 RepID=UPI003DA47A9E
TVTSTITDNPANKDTSNPTTPIEPTSPSDTTPKYGEEDSVYVVITENRSVKEGENLVHNLKLVDKDGNEVKIPAGETVTVTLKYTSITGTINDSDFSNTRLVTVILNSDGKATITNTSVVDNIVEGSEKYTLTIDKITQNVGTFENIVVGDTKGDGKSVTGEIKDNPVKIVLVAVTQSDIGTDGKVKIENIVKTDGSGEVDLDKNTNQTPEGGKLYYVPVAIDSNG